MISYWVSENLAKLFNVLFSSVLLPFFIWFNRDLKVSRYLFAYSLSFISLQGSNGLLKVSNLIEWLDFLYAQSKTLNRFDYSKYLFHQIFDYRDH